MAQITVTVEKIQKTGVRSFTYPTATSTIIDVGENYDIVASGTGATIYSTLTDTEYTVQESATAVGILIDLASATDDYYMRIVQGNVDGQSVIHKFGRNPTIDTASGFEAIWNGGGSYTGHDATAAQTVEVFSSDDADNGTSATGALTIELFGLDSTYTEQTETITLNGVTVVETANTYLRLNRMIVRTAGGGNVNAGTITARQKTTTANIFAVLPIGYNQTMIAAYTIPLGKSAFLTGWFSAWAKKQSGFSNIRLLMRPIDEVFQVKEEFTLNSTGTSYVLRDYKVPKGIIAAKTDIVVMADSSVNATGISAGFDLVLKDV